MAFKNPELQGQDLILHIDRVEFPRIDQDGPDMIEGEPVVKIRLLHDQNDMDKFVNTYKDTLEELSVINDTLSLDLLDFLTWCKYLDCLTPSKP